MNTKRRRTNPPQHVLDVLFLLVTQMIYYVDNLVDTISFYHGLLKEDGRLLIVLAARKLIPVPINGE